MVMVMAVMVVIVMRMVMVLMAMMTMVMAIMVVMVMVIVLMTVSTTRHLDSWADLIRRCHHRHHHLQLPCPWRQNEKYLPHQALDRFDRNWSRPEHHQHGAVPFRKSLERRHLHGAMGSQHLLLPGGPVLQEGDRGWGGSWRGCEGLKRTWGKNNRLKAQLSNWFGQ